MDKIIQKIDHGHQLLLRYAQTHPKSMTGGLVVGTTLFGMGMFKLLDDGDDIAKYKRDPKQKMSLEEARLIAMLENAKESSFQENIQNVVEAQEKFMLPPEWQRDENRNTGRFPSSSSSSPLGEKLDQRSYEILRQQHQQIDKERGRKETNTKFWKNT